MSRQTATLKILREYFSKKGKFLTVEEYNAEDDAPIRYQLVKRVFGSWSRLKGLVGEVATKADAPKPAAPKPAAKPAAARAKPVEETPTDNG